MLIKKVDMRLTCILILQRNQRGKLGFQSLGLAFQKHSQDSFQILLWVLFMCKEYEIFREENIFS